MLDQILYQILYQESINLNSELRLARGGFSYLNSAKRLLIWNRHIEVTPYMNPQTPWAGLHPTSAKDS